MREEVLSLKFKLALLVFKDSELFPSSVSPSSLSRQHISVLFLIKSFFSLRRTALSL